jgi:hypothetical protein
VPQRKVLGQVGSFGICGGQSGTGPSFLRVFQFPLPIVSLPTAPHSSPKKGSNISQLKFSLRA